MPLIPLRNLRCELKFPVTLKSLANRYISVGLIARVAQYVTRRVQFRVLPIVDVLGTHSRRFSSYGIFRKFQPYISGCQVVSVNNTVSITRRRLD